MPDVPAAAPPYNEPGSPGTLLKFIREEYTKDLEIDRDNWLKAVDDLRFLALDQWDEQAKADREAENRPCLVFDLISEKQAQITGDMRMNRPAIKVRPAEESDVDMSEVLTGLIRHIEHQSDAQTAYVTAGISASRAGVGNFRIVTQYTSDESFEQEIRIQRMKNPFTVVWDRNAVELTREDANHCYVLSQMSRTAFEALYPGASLTEFEDESPEKGIWTRDWYAGEKITVAEFWCKKKADKTIAMQADGSAVDVTGKTPAEIAAMPLAQGPDGKPRIREVKTHTVEQYIVNGAEILEGPHVWAGKYIPIIPVWGEEIEIGEKTIRFGAIRRAKDQQRIANYTISAAVETAAMQPKAPYIGTVEQFSGGVQKFWDRATRSLYPYLPYNHDPKVPGPPQRQPPPQLDVAMVQLFQVSADAVKSGMGIHDAALGARSNETSGKAILARQREADVGTYLYTDNLAKAVAYCGRQLVDLIPKIYDTERSLRVLGEDGAQRFVRINQVLTNGKIWNDLSVGTYDVVVETGPSFSTRRLEAADTMQQFVQAVPAAGPLIMDLMVKNMDAAGADEMAKRLRKGLAPGLADPEPGDPQQPAAPSPQDLAAAQAEAEAQVHERKTEVDTRSKMALQEQKHAHDVDLLHEKSATGMEQTIVAGRVRGAEAERQTAMKGEQSERQMMMRGEQAERQSQMRVQGQGPGQGGDAMQAMAAMHEQHMQAMNDVSQQLAQLTQLLSAVVANRLPA